jgi:hypothetical protein
MNSRIQQSLKTLQAFVDLLKNNRAAFSETAWQNLPKLYQEIAPMPDDSAVEAARAINAWCREQKHVPLRDALDIAATRAEVKKVKPTDPKQEEMIKENVLLVKDTLQNAINPATPASGQP